MANPQAYNVVWDSPSHDAQGSVPLGNGEIGLNAWMSFQGELCFYIGRTDSWGDNGRLLKIGRVRLVLDPPPNISVVRQTLDLATGTWHVRTGPCPDHHRNAQMDIRLWVDAHHPIVHVDVASTVPVTAAAHIELWRTAPQELQELQISDIMLDRTRPDQKRAATIVEPDTVLREPPDWIGWFHHNVKSVGPALTAELQGLAEFERPDPLLNRVFGAAIATRHGTKVGDWVLQAAPGRTVEFQVPVLTLHPSSPAAWQSAMADLIATVRRADLAARRSAHVQWWKAFWERSWIEISAREATASREADLVSRSYALQRYVQACAGRGRYPIKFNGSLFTVPYPGKAEDADYRRWGPGYWWQNTRLPYYNMCAAGDYEMLKPLFRMYAQDLLALWHYRTQRYFGHYGIFFSECVYFWGDVFPETYGWTPYEDRDDPLQESRYHKWEWVGGLELACLMLDYFDHLQDQAFLRKTVLPFAHLTLRFFTHYYPTNDAGKLVMHPSQALETWWDCTNPLPEIAGLRAVAQRLLALPAEIATPYLRKTWKDLLQSLPELPTREEEGVRMLAPADAYAERHNIENAELYAVFPFRLLSFAKDPQKLALTALQRRRFLGYYGWRQNDLFLAYLGLADSARAAVVSRAGNRNHDCQGIGNPERAMQNHSRFPAFWGPNYDWYPDQCHGGVLNTTLQAMLLQWDGPKIYLCPAWPRAWDVSFKLNAPYRTTIEGTVKRGVLDFRVTPASRRADVTICLDTSAAAGDDVP